jgi:hypothetical protein
MSITVAEDHTNCERLRYVAENFESLQGLKSVLIGGGFVLIELPGVVRPWWLELLFSLLGLGLMLAAFRYIPKYYERRFGSVESRVVPMKPIAAILFLVFVVMAILWPVLARYANPVFAEVSKVAHRMISDRDHRANLLPVLVSFALLCAPVINRSHFGRRRMVVFGACLLLFWTGVSAFLPLRYPEVTQLMLWRILNAAWLGVSLMLLGLYQHLTLVHLLPARGLNHAIE